MNIPLTEQITVHIFAGLGLVSIPSIQHVQSIVDKKFKLQDKKINFSSGSQQIQRSVYAAQIKLSNKEFKIMVGDCSQDSETPEFCAVVQLTGLPAYGLYMICDPDADPEALIAVSMNNKDWMPCTTFLQATLLAAMEHLHDVGMGWGKPTQYQEMYDTLLTMIKFHSDYYEESNEGQENRL